MCFIFFNRRYIGGEDIHLPGWLFPTELLCKYWNKFARISVSWKFTFVRKWSYFWMECLFQVMTTHFIINQFIYVNSIVLFIWIRWKQFAFWEKGILLWISKQKIIPISLSFHFIRCGYVIGKKSSIWICTLDRIC